jgi:hypothetical protein
VTSQRAKRALAISFDGDVVADELRSLRAYLLDEPSLRGLVSLRRPAPDRDALAGGLPDAVLVALGDGSPMAGSVRTLSQAIARWFEARRSAFRLRVTGPDGRAVDIDIALDGSATGVTAGLNAVLDDV